MVPVSRSRHGMPRSATPPYDENSIPRESLPMTGQIPERRLAHRISIQARLAWDSAVERQIGSQMSMMLWLSGYRRSNLKASL